MALTQRARILIGLSIFFSCLSMIMLFVVADGGAWEGTSITVTDKNYNTFSFDLDFGLANVKLSIFGVTKSVSYDDLYSLLMQQQGVPDNIADDFNKMKTGGKVISAMIGIAVTAGFLNLTFLILMLVNKAPKLHRLAPTFGAMLAFFAALPFVIWIAMPHEALRDVAAMTPAGETGFDGFKLHWCFALSIVAFVFSLATMFVSLRARDAALDTNDATPYAMPVGGEYVPPAGVAYHPLQDPAQGQPYNPYGANPYGNNAYGGQTGPLANQYNNTSQPN